MCGAAGAGIMGAEMGEHTMEFLHFPENITRLRQAQGLTQEVLADHIGVTKASVSKWERGGSLR